jgi:hypothetical protein
MCNNQRLFGYTFGSEEILIRAHLVIYFAHARFPYANGDGSKTRTRLSPRAQTFSPKASPNALGHSGALSVRKTNHESVRWLYTVNQQLSIVELGTT